MSGTSRVLDFVCVSRRPPLPPPCRPCFGGARRRLRSGERLLESDSSGRKPKVNCPNCECELQAGAMPGCANALAPSRPRALTTTICVYIAGAVCLLFFHHHHRPAAREPPASCDVCF